MKNEKVRSNMDSNPGLLIIKIAKNSLKMPKIHILDFKNKKSLSHKKIYLKMKK